MADDERFAYRVEHQDGGYQVIDPAGYRMMTCQDSRSAEHYAALLSRAYGQGYKAGYRAARSAAS